MKPNFKVGDWVECIDVSPLSDGRPCKLKMGEKYRIRYVWDHNSLDIIDIFGNTFNNFKAKRFQPTNQNTDMKLKCINAKDSNSLIQGETYTKVDTNEHGNISVMTSKGHILTHYYKPERFVEVKERVVAPEPAFDITKEYKTREGNKVKILVISEDPDYPVLGVFQENGKWNNANWNLNGKFVADNCDDGLDLIEVRPRQYFMPVSEGFATNDVQIDLEDETVAFESYVYSFEQLRKIVNKIDK